MGDTACFSSTIVQYDGSESIFASDKKSEINVLRPKFDTFFRVKLTETDV